MIVGIDLGTTKSSVGFWHKDRPVIITDNNGNLSIPSEAILTRKNGELEISVGRRALFHKSRYDNDAVRIESVKRLMGRYTINDSNFWTKYPQFISAFILAELKMQAEAYLNTDVTEAVIAIPSHFDFAQRRSTVEAAEIAGLKVKRLLNEATASAMAYSFTNPGNKNILIVDIGGGTTDISYVDIISDLKKFEYLFKVKCIEGDTNIGGVDFNALHYDWLFEKIQKTYNLPSFKPELGLTVFIKEEIEKCKKELSGNTTTTLHIPYYQPELEINGISIELKREELEALSIPLYSKIISFIKEVVDTNKIDVSKLDNFLLVGGGSKTFGLKNRIISEFNVLEARRINPETCVVEGAIIQAAIFAKKVNSVVVDVLQDNYGIELLNKEYEIFLRKDSYIPQDVQKELTTTEDNQEKIEIRIFKGTKPSLNKSEYIGKVELGIRPQKKGEAQILVKFHVDANMVISISAKTLNSEPVSITLESEFGLLKHQIDQMKDIVKIWSSKKYLGMD